MTVVFGPGTPNPETLNAENLNPESLNHMTTIGMHYDVIPGKETEFENGFLAVLEHLKGVAGHVESHLYRDVAGRGSYLILSEWESKEQFEAFMQSDAFKSAKAWGRAEILRSRPRHKIYGHD